MTDSVYHKKVKDFATRDIVSLHADATIHEALTLMGENRVAALPVVDRQNRCVGMLSAADLVDLARDTDDDLRELDVVDLSTKRFLIDKLAHSMGNESVQSFMSESLVTVDLETSIGKAAQEMLRYHVHHLPVVNFDDELVGIVSTMDILSEFADGSPEATE